MSKRNTKEIEIGDLVTIVEGDNAGWSGVLDNVWLRDGVETFAVVEGEDFYYATEIKLLKKA